MSHTATYNDFITDFSIPNPYTALKKVFQADDKNEKTSYGDSSELNTMLFKAQPSQIREYTMNNYILLNLKARINRLTIHERWNAEGVAEPNYMCREKAFEVVAFLYKRYDYHPDRIGPSKEGGIFIHYVNYINNKTLSVEVSNGLEIAALVNRDKEILWVIDVFNFDFNGIIPVYAS